MLADLSAAGPAFASLPIGMGAVLRTLAASLLALAPGLLAGGSSPGSTPDDPGSMSPPLRATLRAAPPAQVPRWLKDAVCDRAVALGEACLAVAAAVAQESQLAGLDPVLMLAVIEVESGWDPGAVSHRDARGLMQLRGPTLEDEAAAGALPSRDAHDPLVNVRAGIRYYARLLTRFQDPELALVAYNAGPNRLAAYLQAERGLPARFWEYPRRVHREQRRLRARLATPPPMVAASVSVRAVQ